MAQHLQEAHCDTVIGKGRIYTGTWYPGGSKGLQETGAGITVGKTENPPLSPAVPCVGQLSWGQSASCLSQLQQAMPKTACLCFLWPVWAEISATCQEEVLGSLLSPGGPCWTLVK